MATTKRRPAGAKARTATDPESRAALAKPPSTDKFRDAVRVAKFEIAHIETDDIKSVWKRWDELAGCVQELTNMLWQQWLLWHLEQGTPGVLREYISLAKAWHSSDPESRGDKPKLSIQAIPKELSNLIYHRLAAAFPSLNRRTLVLAQNAIAGKITSRKSANGSLPGWWSILLCRESIPSSTRAQPIPFDKKSCELIGPHVADDEYRLKLRIDRVDQPGKKNATSTVDEIILKTKHRKAAGQKAILDNILSGDYAFCGSNLVWDDRNRKWFVHLAFKRPVEVVEVGNDTAVLRPGQRTPWRLLVKGRVYWRMFGDGRDVAYQRHNLLSQRWSRQERYRRSAGSASKGHGTDRALQGYFKLEQNWKNYVKTRNHTATGQLVRFCLERGIGTLVYVQPAGGFSEGRLLGNAGKHPDRRDSTGWDWHQVAAMLGYKCKDAGIHLIVRKHDVRERRMENGGKQELRHPVDRKPLPQAKRHKELARRA